MLLFSQKAAIGEERVRVVCAVGGEQVGCVAARVGTGAPVSGTRAHNDAARARARNAQCDEYAKKYGETMKSSQITSANSEPQLHI